MNRHFEDTRYYLRRAGETAKAGIAAELESVRERFQELTGGDEEPDANRLNDIREELRELQERAEGEAKEAIADAREKLDEYRGKQEA